MSMRWMVICASAARPRGSGEPPEPQRREPSLAGSPPGHGRCPGLGAALDTAQPQPHDGARRAGTAAPTGARAARRFRRPRPWRSPRAAAEGGRSGPPSRSGPWRGSRGWRRAACPASPRTAARPPGPELGRHLRGPRPGLAELAVGPGDGPPARRAARGPLRRPPRRSTTGRVAVRSTSGTRCCWPSERSRAMKYAVPVAAPRLATASTIRNSDVAVKKAPTAALLKLRVMITVNATVLSPATPAPTRLSRPPRATSVSRRSTGGVPAGAAVGWLTRRRHGCTAGRAACRSH